jgi:hypothetical protein
MDHGKSLVSFVPPPSLSLKFQNESNSSSSPASWNAKETTPRRPIQRAGGAATVALGDAGRDAKVHPVVTDTLPFSLDVVSAIGVRAPAKRRSHSKGLCNCLSRPRTRGPTCLGSLTLLWRVQRLPESRTAQSRDEPAVMPRRRQIPVHSTRCPADGLGCQGAHVHRFTCCDLFAPLRLVHDERPVTLQWLPAQWCGSSRTVAVDQFRMNHQA